MAAVGAAFGYFFGSGVAAAVVGAVAGAALKEIYDFVIEEIAENVAVDTMSQRLVSKKGGNLARQIIYGKCRTGGTIVYLAATGDKNEYLHQITVFASHEIESFRTIYYNDSKAAKYIGSGSPTIANRRYLGNYAADGSGSGDTDANYTLVTTRNGTLTQSAVDTSNLDADKQLPSSHGSNHRYFGHAYVYTRFTGTKGNPYDNGAPNVTAEIEGKKLYDPQKDSTSSIYDSSLGTSSHRDDDPSTWEYSTNPALCVLDYLTDTKYGAGILHSEIDYDSLDAAINRCNESTNYGDSKLFECNGVLSTASSIRQNIAQLLSSMNGRLTFSGGKYHIDAYEYKTPHSTVIDDSMFIGSVSIKTRKGNKDLYNRVSGSYMAETHNYVQKEFSPQVNDAAAAIDGGVLEHEMNLSMTTQHEHAYILAALTLLKSRMSASIRFSLGIEGLQYRVGDNIQVKHDTIGYNPKIFEITSLSIKPSKTTGITVDIQGIETQESIYTYNSALFSPDESSTSLDLFDAYEVNPPTSFVAMPIYHVGDFHISGNAPKVGAHISWKGATGNIRNYMIRITNQTTGKFREVVHTDIDDTYEEFYSLDPDTVYDLSIKTMGFSSRESTPLTGTFTTGQSNDVGTGEFYYQTIDDIDDVPSESSFLEYFGKHATKGDQIVVLQLESGVNTPKVIDSATYVYRPELSFLVNPQYIFDNSAGISYARSIDSGLTAIWQADIETEVKNEDVTWTIESSSLDFCSDSSITSLTDLTITELEDTDEANVARLKLVVDPSVVGSRDKDVFHGHGVSYYEIGICTVRAAWDQQYVEKTFTVAAILYEYAP